MKGNPSEEAEQFSKKMKIFKSLTVPKNQKGKTLWDFLAFVLLQIIKKMKEGPFGYNKKFSKKVSQSWKKRESQSAAKSENFLLHNTCKKISAYARVRTQTLWVEKQASYH